MGIVAAMQLLLGTIFPGQDIGHCFGSDGGWGGVHGEARGPVDLLAVSVAEAIHLTCAAHLEQWVQWF